MRSLISVFVLLAGCAGAQVTTSTAVSGTVRLAGEVPARNKIPFGSESYRLWEAKHPDGLWSESYIVDESKGVKWAFVRIVKGLEGKTFEPPKDPRVIETAGCAFSPHVIGVMVGQRVVFRNADELTHGCHIVGCYSNPERTFVLEGRGAEVDYTFRAAEDRLVMVRFPCSAWEPAWMGVVSNPYYAVTDEHGRFEIRGLPPGKYTLEARYPNGDYAPATQEFEIDSKDVNIPAIDLRRTRQ